MRNHLFPSFILRRIFFCFLILLEIGVLVVLILIGGSYSGIISLLFRLLSLLVALYVVSKKDKGGYKLIWVFLVLLMPTIGGVMYIFFNNQRTTKSYVRASARVEAEVRPLFRLPPSVKTAHLRARHDAPSYTVNMRYLDMQEGFPVYSNTETEFLTPGEVFFPRLLEELEKAEKYIFMEYFIIENGVMWDAIIDILERKAAQGIEVRIIYDDVGCFLTLPKHFRQNMQDKGIKCIIFNPFSPFVTTIQNNRDHRKITAIDGKCAFTGGINLSDEYINVIQKHGYWKDSAIMVRGEAAWSLTLFFLEIWQIAQKAPDNYYDFYPWKNEAPPTLSATQGYVQPYCDSPIDSEHVSEHVYMHMITTAQKYIYISTPYLIIDDSMISALCLAAKSGIDVRIVTPGKWDKLIIYQASRSSFRDLVTAGVKIYTYTPGFIHSKAFIVDDRCATVGTVNLDYRSLYLHFECGVWLLDTPSIASVKEDFMQILDVSDELLPEELRYNPTWSVARQILRLFAPIL